MDMGVWTFNGHGCPDFYGLFPTTFGMNGHGCPDFSSDFSRIRKSILIRPQGVQIAFLIVILSVIPQLLFLGNQFFCRNPIIFAMKKR
jgi:hypothetical protein